jgi:Holliday junction resolvase
MGKPSRDKGRRYELEVVQWHKDLGLRAERVPLSGAARYQGNGGDVDLYAFGPDAAPIIAECKIRAKLPKCWRDWMGDSDATFMRDNHGETIVLLPVKTWVRLVKR